MVETSNDITDDEAALYDRQIRLWGLEAQKRLRTCRVLLCGLNGLGAEIAKNVVLSGVKSITLLDNENVKEEDFCSQFLILSEDLGKNRAECSLSQVQCLNPMVEVKAVTESISNKQDEFFYNFDVVILTNSSKDEMFRIDELCREKNIKFFTSSVFGFFGYSFTNLHEHTFMEEINVCGVDLSSDSTIKGKPEKKIVQKTIQFPSLKEVLDKNWTLDKNSQQLKTLSSHYFILQTLLKFQSTKNRRPSHLSRNEDIALLSQLSEEIIEKMGVGRDRIDDKIFSSVFAELSPVCSVVGGILVQEVVKCVTCKDAPHNNFFFFNALQDSGIVECIEKD